MHPQKLLLSELQATIKKQETIRQQPVTGRQRAAAQKGRSHAPV